MYFSEANPPKRLIALLDAALCDLEDLADDVIDAEADFKDALTIVDDCRLQIRHEEEGLTNRAQQNPDWVFSAQRAVRLARNRCNLFEYHLKKMKAEIRVKRREEEAAQSKANAKAKKAAFTKHQRLFLTENAICLAACRKLIDELPSEWRAKFYDALNAAQQDTQLLNQTIDLNG